MTRLLPLLTLLTAALLVGCATTVTQTEVEIQRVEVTIPVPCLAEVPPAPVMPADAIVATDSLYVKVRALLAERRVRLAYEAELLAALKSCK